MLGRRGVVQLRLPQAIRTTPHVRYSTRYGEATGEGRPASDVDLNSAAIALGRGIWV